MEKLYKETLLGVGIIGAGVIIVCLTMLALVTSDREGANDVNSMVVIITAGWVGMAGLVGIMVEDPSRGTRPSNIVAMKS